ncbi:hypothetical protein Tco_0522305 [Tanacetum coccineum]
MVWSGYALLMSGKTNSIKINNILGCLPGSTFVFSEVFKLDFSLASHHVVSSSNSTTSLSSVSICLSSTSPFHLAGEDIRLSNLKFVPKGEEDKKVATEKEEKKKSASTKQTKPKPAIKNSSKPAPAPKPKVTKENPSMASTAKPPKPKPAKEKSTKATPLQKASKGKVTKVRNVKSSFQLVDEPDEEPAQPEPEPEPEPEHHGDGEEYDVERAIQMSLESFQAEGHAHVGGDNVTEEVNLEDKTVEIDEGQAGSDPGKTPES